MHVARVLRSTQKIDRKSLAGVICLRPIFQDYICANIYSAKLNTIKSPRLEEIN